MLPSIRPCLPSRSLFAETLLRTFSTTSSRTAKSHTARLEAEHSSIPPYPYGPSQWYKQSNFGLYGGLAVRSGNMVSKKNEIKTRRTWRPNVQQKRLWSVALKKMIRVRVTSRVLRTIDKVGGLDEYLLGEKTARVRELGMGGWKLRWRVMQTEAVRERFRAEREKLGLPPRELGDRDVDGVVVGTEAVEEEVRRYDAAMEGRDGEVELGVEQGFMTTVLDPKAEESPRVALHFSSSGTAL
jgi:large subunit ribosomal protein L28